MINIPYQSNYSLLPWSAYALVGVDAGRLLIKFDEQPQVRSTWLCWLLIAGAISACLFGIPVAISILTMSDGQVPTQADVLFPFWYPFPAFNLFHCGILLVEFAVVAWTLQVKGSGSAALSPRPRPDARLVRLALSKEVL